MRCAYEVGYILGGGARNHLSLIQMILLIHLKAGFGKRGNCLCDCDGYRPDALNSDLICAVHTSIVLVHLLVWKLVNGEDLCGFHCSGLNLDGSFATVGI